MLLSATGRPATWLALLGRDDDPDAWFELTRQLVNATSGARQLDDPTPVFRRVWWMGSWHWGTPSCFLPNTVYENGSTSVTRARCGGADRSGGA
jgi:hypothetical protein